MNLSTCTVYKLNTHYEPLMAKICINQNMITTRAPNINYFFYITILHDIW